MSTKTITIYRAPVLTLWAVVSERLGFDPAEALSLGKALAGLNAQTKGRSLGIFNAARGKARDGAIEEAGRRVPREVVWSTGTRHEY
jgi:hypothetical protein